MANIFFISDTHFGHKNMLQFKGADGLLLRPFVEVVEMNQYIIDRWNSVVQAHDKVYHLGDVALQMRNLDILSELRGNKILIRGNHDKMDLSQYAKHFKDVRGVEYRGEYGMTLSHVPIHPNHHRHGYTNVHGHLHDREVLMEDGTPDPRYFNVSVERLDYTPIELNELKGRINARLN